MVSAYRPEEVARYFDELGMGEWERLIRSPTDEVSIFIHTHYLKKHIRPGQRVLEIGAGPGRFTQILAGLGARMVVADLSNVQLELNKNQAIENGFSDSISDWKQMDICDMSEFKANSFDCVVAYGGLFSYVLDQRDLALSECLRVLNPEGMLFLSVMSMWGTMHRFLDSVLALPVDVNQRITNTGDLTTETYPERQGNFMHLFRVDELVDWLEKSGLSILDKSASNCLSLVWGDQLKETRADSEKWSELLRMELAACADEGCIGLGTHIIAVTQKGSLS